MTASNDEVLRAVQELEKKLCDAGMAGGCAEVRSLRTELVAHIATQAEINQRTKEVILEVFGNGKPGLKQDMQDVRHDIRDLREDTNKGFDSLGKMISAEKEAREKDKDDEKKEMGEKVLTWEWIREKFTIPLVMVVLFFLAEYLLKILLT